MPENNAQKFIKICKIQPMLTYSFYLKELEHRKLGWKVLILKYNLGNSLSKEM